MNPIQEQLNSLIRRLKQAEGLEEVRFVREYAVRNIETPIGGFLAVVGLNSAERGGFAGAYAASGIKGESYRAEGEIKLYAPVGENGGGLSELAAALLGALSEADEEKIITEAKAGSIEFDKNTNSIFRRIIFSFEFCVCGDDESE